MNQIQSAKFKPFFFVPHAWEDLFTDAVIDSYVEVVKLESQFYFKTLPPVPLALHLIDEDEIILIIDKITCDMEYGLHYPELVIFKDEKEDDEFQALCLENLYFSIHDINMVFERYHMAYKLGDNFKNLPFKEVW